MDLRSAFWPAVAIAIAVLLAPACIALYRHLTGLRLDARSALAQIEEQMHRRHQALHRLIDNDPDEREKDGLRVAAALPGQRVQDKVNHERGVRWMVSHLCDKVENAEVDLLDDLERTRLKIDFAACYYNEVVERYNGRLRKGVGKIARLTGFKPHEKFDLDD